MSLNVLTTVSQPHTGWSRVAVITSQDSYGQGGLSAFLSVAQSYNIRVLLSVTTDGTEADVESKVKLLKVRSAHTDVEVI
jgi:hypothetical protein